MASSMRAENVSEREYVPVDEAAIGLDRANITSRGQIQLPSLDTSQNDDLQVDRDLHSTSGLVNALKERKHHAGIKIREKLHIQQKPDNLSTQAPVLANAAKEKSGSRLVEKLPIPEKPTVRDFFHNPIDTVKSKVSNQSNQQVAENLAAKEIPHGQEVDLIKAHDAIKCATTEHEKVDAQKQEAELIKARQATLVRWSIDRHVTKVRLLPRATMVRKSCKDFQNKNLQGELVTDWKGYRQHLLVYYAHQYGGQYIGYGSDPPAPSKESIMPNIERLIIATSPFQELIMTTRKVYLWEDPKATTKYLLIYLVLWYLDLLLPGTLSFLLYLVVERRLHGISLEDLRQDIEHREDKQAIALSLAEFIAKRGDENWADDIVQVLGPWLMVQLADLANFFESIRNFYEWRKPYRTLATLTVLASCILVTIFIPTWLLIKSTTFAMGFTFFALFPLSAKFPEYRLLLSPAKRILWNIPTHAEWAIQYIQAEGARALRNTDSHADKVPLLTTVPFTASTEVVHSQDIGFYKAHDDEAAGHLIISAASCGFVSNIGHNMHFNLPYEEINTVEKEDRIVAKKMPSRLSSDSGKDLKLVTKSGQVYLLTNMDQRNEAFSQILGFSKATWQIVW